MSNMQYQIEMKNIVKHFGGVQALKDVSIQIRPGEIHALVGENGAGKSTLMKILSGAVPRDSGEIIIGGKSAGINNPKDGLDHGISTIYQEFALIDSLTVAENIYIDNLAENGKVINWKKLYSKARECLGRLGFADIDVRKSVSQLSVAHQQVIEICKALARESTVLVLDEPTAVLSFNEAEKLFGLLKELRNKGVTIIYISHRLNEIFRLSDRITIMKDGSLVGTYDKNSLTENKLTNLMIGRELESYFPARCPKIGGTIFKAENVCCKGSNNTISFEVSAGEVLGVYGLVGAGRTEVFRTIIGADKMSGGDIYYYGRHIKILSPTAALKHGIGMLPEDRKSHGVILSRSIRENITLTRLKSLVNSFGMIVRKRETDYINSMVDKLSIRTASIENKVSSLSGGNQQKVAIAKLLASDCRVLIFDEPTRGVDVGAKIEIYKIINDLVSQGYAVIMISSEMMEIIGMCDRAIVMRNGKIAGELDKSELSEQSLIKYSMGAEDYE